MSRNSTHQITVCTSCRHKGENCRPGYELIERLRAAIAAAGEAIPEDFEISGTACMEGCDRPCTVAFFGSRKASYLFGDIDPDQDIADLVDFARQYAFLNDGWCASVDRPSKLRKSTLARVPAAMIALEPSTEVMQ
jgi:predicted metal-binding protein